jgi:hypothetical protein
MSNNTQATVTTQADHLRWALDLIQSDTLAAFNAAKDQPSEFALLDFAHVLAEAETKIKRRHEAFLQGS